MYAPTGPGESTFAKDIQQKCQRYRSDPIAPRHLGWRQVEVVREIPGLAYSAAAQGIRRFWMQLPQDAAKERFRQDLLSKMSNVKI